MEYMGGWLRVRVPLKLRAALDREAEREGLTTSLWVRRVLFSALPEIDRVETGLAMVDGLAEGAVAVADHPEPVVVSSPAAVQPTPVKTEQQKAAEAAHWEKVARMQKIKGAGQ